MHSPRKSSEGRFDFKGIRKRRELPGVFTFDLFFLRLSVITKTVNKSLL